MMLSLPKERGEQLRAYAEENDLGYVEAIGQLLREVGAADHVPGFSCFAFEPTRSIFLLQIDGFHVPLASSMVLEIAQAVEECISTTGGGGRRMPLEKDGVTKDLIIARHRRHSIAIVARDPSEGVDVRRTLTLDLARDLAAQLRKAVSPH